MHDQVDYKYINRLDDEHFNFVGKCMIGRFDIKCSIISTR